MVDILFGSSENKDLLNVGLVPWNGKVNVRLNNGPAFDPALTQTVTVPSFTHPLDGSTRTEVYYANNSPVPLLDPPPSGWQGCINARYRAPLPLGTPTVAECTLRQRRRRLVQLAAVLHARDDDTVFAESEASFMLEPDSTLGAA